MLNAITLCMNMILGILEGQLLSVSHDYSHTGLIVLILITSSSVSVLHNSYSNIFRSACACPLGLNFSLKLCNKYKHF